MVNIAALENSSKNREIHRMKPFRLKDRPYNILSRYQIYVNTHAHYTPLREHILKNYICLNGVLLIRNLFNKKSYPVNFFCVAKNLR